MKKYFLIIAGLFLIGCSNEKSYWVNNASEGPVDFKTDDKTVTKQVGECLKVKESEFPVKVGEVSADEPNHYSWDGSQFNKVEDEKAIEILEAVCKRPPPSGDGAGGQGGASAAGQGTPVAGQGTPAAGQGTPAAGQGTPAAGQGTPVAGQSSSGSHHPPLTSTTAGQSSRGTHHPSRASTYATYRSQTTATATYQYMAGGTINLASLAACFSYHNVAWASTFTSSDGESCEANFNSECGAVEAAWKNKYEDQGWNCTSVLNSKPGTGPCRSALMTRSLSCRKTQ